ncbi:hypothetical protein [Emcibacter sp.]|uniref:hypothetical protein n=1 Tax=Emcibacter sp. TaxID=1979954 RepID=UPI003A910C98
MDTGTASGRGKLHLVIDNSSKAPLIFSRSRWKKLMLLGNEARETGKYCLARFYYDRANREAVAALAGLSGDPSVGAQELYDRASAHIIAAESLANIYLLSGDRHKGLAVLIEAFERLLARARNRSLGMVYREVLMESVTIMLDCMVATMRSCGCCPHIISDVMDRAGRAAYRLSQEG